jgi:hypothetical protein
VELVELTDLALEELVDGKPKRNQRPADDGKRAKQNEIPVQKRNSG